MMKWNYIVSGIEDISGWNTAAQLSGSVREFQKFLGLSTLFLPFDQALHYSWLGFQKL